MGRHYDLAVVGAGIVGLGHAVAALRRGLTVAVVDRASGVAGASVRSPGHVGITGQEGEARSYADLARELWLTLAPEAGFWLGESGAVVVARAADELAVLEEARERRGGHDVRLLTPAQVRERVPVAEGVAVGGAFLAADLQLDPREAVAAIVRWLDAHGVDFFWKTPVLAVETGTVHTARGRVAADAVVVAVGHDVDQLFPGMAEAHGIQRCGVDMMLVDAVLDTALAAPVLTGWSLLRSPAFARTPSAEALRERLTAQQPALAALDAEEVYAQRPDGALVVGGTRHRGDDVSPFQAEAAYEAMLQQTRELFAPGALRVRERWQGVYASAPDDFLVAAPHPGVRVVSVTSGIGLTTGLGLADRIADELFADAPGSLIPVGATRVR